MWKLHSCLETLLRPELPRVCSQAKWSLLLVRDRHTLGVHPLSVLNVFKISSASYKFINRLALGPVVLRPTRRRRSRPKADQLSRISNPPAAFSATQSLPQAESRAQFHRHDQAQYGA